MNMKRLVVAAVLTFLVVIVAEGQTASQNEPAASVESIAGIYSLSHWQYSDNKPVAQMAIIVWSKDTFLVRGVGEKPDQVLIGMGGVDGREGYYEWKFADGKAGRTTFVVNADGTLKGHVLGSGLDWWYLARRAQSGPEKK